jgi:hypothetical protein
MNKAGVMADAAFRLTATAAAQLRAGLGDLAQRVVAAVVSEVPSYADPFRRGMGRQIETAVRVALDGFLQLASGPGSGRPRAQLQQVHDAAYALGQGEARAGRSIDALTSAYGVGARVAWRDMGAGAIDSGMAASEVSQFAELVFAYINELSVRSINGHAEELASSGQVRQRRLERLCRKLLEGAPESDLLAAARLADWEPPRLLTAVLVPEPQANAVAGALDARALQPGEDLEGLAPELTVLLVAAGGGRDRATLRRALASSTAIIGPARPWAQAHLSYARTVQAHRLGLAQESGPVDTEAHLVELVIGAEPAALADLRARALAPLDTVTSASREKLAATLRAWVLHHGRRDDIAAALFVHPQTVRYRMGQLRDLYGERLSDPRFVLELTIALA